MSLFGRGKPNTDKFFDPFARKIFGYVAQSVESRSSSAESARPFVELYQGLWSGGMIAAKLAIRLVPSITRAWGRGDNDKAAHLSLLFTLPMVVRYHRRSLQAREVRLPSDGRLRVYQAGISNIASTFQVPPLDNQQLASEYLSLAVQFDYSEDHRESTGKSKGSFLEPRFLLSRALALYGYPPTMDISPVDFPVDSESDFVSRGGKRGEYDEGEVIALSSVLGNSSGATMQLLRE